ncbi:hypothetical protein KI387_011783, partial [Taxus chinensis]
MSFLRRVIGCSKSGICRNRCSTCCDNNSEYSMSVSSTEGLLGSARWKNRSSSSSSSTKTVVVVVDEGRETKAALMWALSHVLHDSQTITLLHILEDRNVTCLPHYRGGRLRRNDGNLEKARNRGLSLVKSLEATCKSYCSEVEVEVVMTEGNKTSTIVSWVKKLEASMLVVGQKKPSLFQRFLRSRNENVVEFCNANAECPTVGVRRRSSRTGGYIINSKE